MIGDLAQKIISLWGDESAALSSEYRDAFAGKHRLLKDLGNLCGVGAAHPIDPNELQRMEGRREVFLHISGMLEISPADFLKLTEGLNYE